MSASTPGEKILHPVVLLSIGALLLNDHYLKATFGNPWTGKISDFAGLLFFPILLQGACEVLLSWAGRYRGHSNGVLAICCGLTGLVFISIQLTTWGAQAYRWGLGFLQMLVSGHWQRLASPPLVRHWADPTDLLALPMLAVALWVGWERGSQHRS